ncbi:hypothetical protein VOLCADRAFT_97965 [Volvox carteri f. nagariensis]|uniref:CobW C-terminal domain-containing protein n=1 Tax=Volvox carteri f. nagariensis TaxID=3068 RepID=D8UE34_VOLCA|nr:uncharacterized protein VOLCADRAFT_97965 [Volvox carteri f. nagariensis]EFJ42055.1 hypothetical protein VOLCADRAFT_97965 [Volvox carteri f. nagariensis]|eukprot:XP_002956930.1 hypothetical protein VOLCADRAFT_97965 [Volvox carteri f. nagariensis]
MNDKAIRGLHPGPDVPPEVLRSRNELFNKLRNQKKNAKTGSLWDNFDVEWWGGLPKLVCLFGDEPLSAANPSFTNAHHIKQGACKAIKQRAASLSQQQQQSGTSSAAAGPSTADQQALSKRRRGIDGQTLLPVIPATLAGQVVEELGMFFYRNNVPIHLIEKPELRNLFGLLGVTLPNRKQLMGPMLDRALSCQHWVFYLALRDVLQVAPDAARILPLPPVLHIQPATNSTTAAGSNNNSGNSSNKNNDSNDTKGGGAATAAVPAFWHIFAAVLQCPDEDLKYVFGEPRGGVWVDLCDLATGETTLLRHILTNREPSMRCAVVVNDMAELNIDAALVAQGSLAAAATASASGAASGGGRRADRSAAVTVTAAAAPERLVELHNGCICCTLRGDLVQQIAEIAADGRFDYCVVESTGIGEPMQVAETFEFPLDGSDPAAALALEAAAAAAVAANDDVAAAAPAAGPRRLADVARLDTCVTVVDAANLLDNLNSLETLKARQEAQKVHAHGGGRRNKKILTAAAAAASYDEVADDLEEQHEESDHDEDEDEEELERNVADLLLDQLEFADVILLNKLDTVPPGQLPRLVALVGAINPSARLLPTTHSQVPLTEVLNTGRFSLERAREGAGWLRAIREGTDLVPETAEYGITSFVWRSRRPFHPARLHAFMMKYFVLQQPDWSMADGGDGGGGDDGDGDACNGAQALPAPTGQAAHWAGGADSAGNTNFGLGGNVAVAAAKAQEAAAALAGAFGGFNAGRSGNLVTAAGTPPAAAATAAAADPAAAAAAKGAAAAAKGAARTAAFGQVLRSKGFAWLAGRDDHVGEWSSAGNLMRFGTGGPWYDVLPREAWPSEPAKVADIEKDFLPEIGDRRQELVFIGIDMLRDQLVAELEASLATPEEEEEIRKVAAVAAAAAAVATTAASCGAGGGGCRGGPQRPPSSLDPFLPWPDIRDIMDAGGDEEEEEEEGEDEEEQDGEEDEEEGFEEEEEIGDDGPVGRWEPGVVLEDLTEGAAELQRLLDETEQPAVVVLWHAPWAAASREAEAGLAALAVRHPQLVFVQLDVTASQANEALAVGGCRLMVLPSSRRSDARPTLRDGSKWPALTLHVPPGSGLQYEAYFAGPSALADLRSELLRRQATWAPDAAAAPPAATSTAAATETSAAPSAATALRRRRQTNQFDPATQPSKPTSTSTGAAAAAAPTAAAAAAVALATSTSKSDCSPDRNSHHHSHSNSQQQQQRSLPPPSPPPPRLVELRRGAADLKAHLLEARDSGSCLVVVAWLSAPPPNYPSTPTASVPSSSASGGAAATSTLATPPPACRSAIQHPSSAPYSTQDGGAAGLELLELSEQEQATLRVDVAAACASYGGSVRVLFADPGASAANRALAEALRVAAAPTLQVYADMKMVKSLKGAAAVGKLAAALRDVAPAPPPLPPPPLLPVGTPSAASAAITSQSIETSPSTLSPGFLPVTAATTTSVTATAIAPSDHPQTLHPQADKAISIYDPPTGKYAKPGMRKQFGPRGRGVYWPRMPCLRCGCPWWLGEDWDAECVRCGWDCEADGYDDDSNPLPAYKAKYDAFTAALREGRTAVWKGKHVGPQG